MALPLSDTQTTETPQLIELWRLDVSRLLPAASTDDRFHYFVDSEQVGGQSISFGGITYGLVRMQATGFERNSTGKQPRPRLRLDNVVPYYTILAKRYDGLIGARVSRMRTMSVYLDGKPRANPNAFSPPDYWTIEQKNEESELSISFTLSTSLDLEGKALPGRRMTKDFCDFVYRSGEGCTYSDNRYFDRLNNPTTSVEDDECSHTPAGCEIRFGVRNIPVGCFPGLVDK